MDFKDPLQLLKDTIEQIDTAIAGKELQNEQYPFQPIVQERNKELINLKQLKQNYISFINKIF
jgi:hypothetical protein